jgi:hypothetical protein
VEWVAERAAAQEAVLADRVVGVAAVAERAAAEEQVVVERVAVAERVAPVARAAELLSEARGCASLKARARPSRTLEP